MNKWYYEIDGVRSGPIDGVNLKKLMGSGAIKPDTIIYEEGMMKPVKASESEFYINGFAPSLWYLPGTALMFGLIAFGMVPLKMLFLGNAIWNISSVGIGVVTACLGMSMSIISLFAIRKGRAKSYSCAVAGLVLSALALSSVIILSVIHF